MSQIKHTLPPGVRVSGPADGPPITISQASLDRLRDEADYVRDLEGQSRQRPALAPALAALKAAREAAGLTVAEAAARAGVSEETLCRLEGGRVSNPGWGTLERCAAAVGLTLTLTATPAAG